MGLIAWIVVGVIAGFLANLVMGGSEGLLKMLILGVIGALVGGFVATSLKLGSVDGINVESIAIATIGAIAVVFVARLAGGRVPLSGRNRIPPEDPDRPDHDQLDDRPADERDDGGDIEDRTRGMKGIRPEDPVERRHE